MFRVALKIHDDIEHSPGRNTDDHAARVVPESLYLLVHQLCSGDTSENGDDSEEEKSGTRFRVSGHIFLLFDERSTDTKASWAGSGCIRLPVQKTW